jgi:hypothetical protein
MGVLSIRKLNDTDYDEILVGWWKDWKWQPIVKDFLPESGTGGMIVYDGDIPVCAGFVYLTNSSAAWVDWIISSKTYNIKPTRKEAINLLISSLTNNCEELGFKYIYALIKHPSLMEVYQDNGYSKGDNYTTEMIKIL